MDTLLFSKQKQCEKRNDQDSDNNSGFSCEFASEERKAKQIDDSLVTPLFIFIPFSLSVWYLLYTLFGKITAYVLSTSRSNDQKLTKFNVERKDWSQAALVDFLIFFFRLNLLLLSVLGTPGEELSKEEKNLAIMAMKKKDKRLYDRIMHSKKKKRSEVKLLF